MAIKSKWSDFISLPYKLPCCLSNYWYWCCLPFGNSLSPLASVILLYFSPLVLLLLWPVPVYLTAVIQSEAGVGWGWCRIPLQPCTHRITLSSGNGVQSIQIRIKRWLDSLLWVSWQGSLCGKNQRSWESGDSCFESWGQIEKTVPIVRFGFHVKINYFFTK